MERWRPAGWRGGVSPPRVQENVWSLAGRRRDAAGPAGADAGVPGVATSARPASSIS